MCGDNEVHFIACVISAGVYPDVIRGQLSEAQTKAIAIYS